MHKASRNRFRTIGRAARKRAIGSLRALKRFDPKSVERSTIIAISLFAGSSIVLQVFAIAHGSLSGRGSGVAQAAVSNSTAPMALASVAGARNLARPTSGAAALRTHRLFELGWPLVGDGRELPRIASTTPADTVLPKPRNSTDPGLRVATFGPVLRGSDVRGDDTSLVMSPRMIGGQPVPAPTRVAFAANPMQGLKQDVAKDRGMILTAGPVASAPRLLGRNGQRVPNSVLKKVHFQDDTPERCLPSDLMSVIYDVAEKFGEVQVLSTFRDPQRNRRVGGAPRSFHLRCQAIDFRIVGQAPGLLEYLEARADVGGLKRYPLGFYHIDNGPRRTW